MCEDFAFAKIDIYSVVILHAFPRSRTSMSANNYLLLFASYTGNFYYD